MRPLFIIYTIAGLTAFFALANACSHGYGIYATRVAITGLAPTGEDRKRLEDIIDAQTGRVVWSATLAGAQIAVCFAARKIKGAAHATS